MICPKIRRFSDTRRTAVLGLLCIALLPSTACETKPAYTPPPPPKVTVSQPVRQNVTDYLELTGNLQAVNTVQLRARVEGYLEKILFQDGQTVKKDQLLFIIQQNTYLAKLQQAEGNVLAQKASLDRGEIELARYSNLYTQKASAQTDVDNWRYQRDSAKGTLLTAEGQLALSARFRKRDPTDGRGAARPGQTRLCLYLDYCSFHRPHRPASSRPRQSGGLGRKHHPGSVGANGSALCLFHCQ
jgi:multidrug efflux pump subunit AcrA (membrane-fusion protein)